LNALLPADISEASRLRGFDELRLLDDVVESDTSRDFDVADDVEGRSVPQASQQRKLGGFSRVQI
jgi:hypothetical protein